MGKLSTDFRDDILSEKMNGKKRVRLIPLEDGTYIVEDATEYTQIGSRYGQKEINQLNSIVNGKLDSEKVMDDLGTVLAVTEEGVPVGCKAVAALNNSLGGLEFAQDAEGNWGYKPAGADTVTPFRKVTKLPNITITAQARVAYQEPSYTPTIGVYVPAGYTKMTLSGATGAVSMYLNSAVAWSAVTGNGTYTIPKNTTRITCRLQQPSNSGEYSITLVAD